MNGSNTFLLQKRQRLAWGVLFGGFLLFVIIAVSIPLILRAYLQNSTDFLIILAQSNQGTLSIDDPVNPPRAALPGEPPQNVAPSEIVLTDASASGLLLVYPPESDHVLARMQLYGTTIVRITEAQTPRFDLSDTPRIFTAELSSGRIRLVVSDNWERPFRVSISTPHGLVSVREPGEYSLTVNNDISQITVQQGSLEVLAQDQSLILEKAQRADIALDSPPVGPLPPERDLLQNGSFGERWSRWVQLGWNIERLDQPEGQIAITEVLGENGLQIVRNGEGHADVGIRQVVDQDVTDINSLLLEVDLRILNQSLGVCGTVGSECPVILRIEYDDINGNPQVWQQGFYAGGSIGADGPPDVCVSCPPPRFEHVQAPLGQLFFFRADLITELQRKGYGPPRRIKSMSVIASGHTFAVEILDIGLFASEGLIAEE